MSGRTIATSSCSPLRNRVVVSNWADARIRDLAGAGALTGPPPAVNRPRW